MRIVIPGHPIPAVRMTQRGKFVKDRAQKYMEYKSRIGWIAKGQIAGTTDKPVQVSVIVYVSGRSGDVDNYLKSALDGLNGVVWKDDRQVVEAKVQKIICTKQEERMEIQIEFERMEGSVCRRNTGSNVTHAGHVYTGD